MVRERWDLPKAEKFWEKRGVQRCLGDGLGGTESACQGAMSERGFEKERCTCGCLAMLDLPVLNSWYWQLHHFMVFNFVPGQCRESCTTSSHMERISRCPVEKFLCTWHQMTEKLLLLQLTTLISVPLRRQNVDMHEN